MARVRSLTNLEDDVRRVADIRNSVTRHPQADVWRMINESCQTLREYVSDNGHEYYVLKETGTFTPGTAAVQIQPFAGSGVTAFMRALAMDVIVNGRAQNMYEWSYEQRNDYGGSGASNEDKGVPVYWRLQQNDVIVLPTPDAAYAWTFYYIPNHIDMSTGTDEFDGVAGWEEWIVWDCAAKVATRDKNTTLYQLATGERAKVEERIRKTAPKRARGRAGHRKDTRGRRIVSERASRWRWY